MADTDRSGSSTVITDAGNKVDEALGTAGSDTSRDMDESARRELQALSREIAETKASLRQATQASRRATRQGAYSLREDIVEQVRSRPLAAVGLAALVGYIYGAAR